MSETVHKNSPTPNLLIESRDESSPQTNTIKCAKNDLSLIEYNQNYVSNYDKLESHILAGLDLSMAAFSNTECDKVELDKTRNYSKTQNVTESLQVNDNIECKENTDHIIAGEPTIQNEIKENEGCIQIKKEIDEDCLESFSSLAETPFTLVPAEPLPKIDGYMKNIKKYICPIEGCTYAFERPGKLENHLRRHANERIFKCCLPYCDKSYTNISHLKRHMQTSHEPEGTPVNLVECTFKGCDKQFQTKSGMRKHFNTSHVYATSRFTCGYCPAFFKFPSLYYTHLLEFHNVQPIKCDFCQIAFTTKHAKNRHMRKHRTFKCDDPRCEGVVFEKYNDKRLHDKLVHPSVYTCNDCNFQTSRKLFLEEHVYRHLPDWVRPMYKCTYGTCKSTFLQMRNYVRHCKYYHSQVHVVFPCTKGCSSTFTTKQSLQRHIATQHDEKKSQNHIDERALPFECKFEKCHKRFASEQKVHRHFLRMHREKRPGDRVLTILASSSTSDQTGGDRMEDSHLNKSLASADHFSSTMVPPNEKSNVNTSRDKNQPH